MSRTFTPREEELFPNVKIMVGGFPFGFKVVRRLFTEFLTSHQLYLEEEKTKFLSQLPSADSVPDDSKIEVKMLRLSLDTFISGLIEDEKKAFTTFAKGLLLDPTLELRQQFTKLVNEFAEAHFKNYIVEPMERRNGAVLKGLKETGILVQL